MEKQVEIHAYHGWGMDDSFWDPFHSVLPGELIFKTANRGYFGKPYFPRFEKDTKIRVVLTHSFGLHWCNTAVLSKADFLVIMNGFGSFYPDSEPLNTLSKKGLELTIRQFAETPEEVIQTFREKNMKPFSLQIKPQPGLNRERAMDDLKAMQFTRFPILDLDFGAVMITMDAGKDHILLEPRGKELIESYVGKKHSKIFDGTGHALPYTNPEICWSYLCSVIPIFRKYENND